MHLMADGLAALGSRLGVVWDPPHRRAFLERFGRHPGLPMTIEAGVEIDGRKLVLPLCDGDGFSFVDQELGASWMRLTGLDAATGLQVRLWAVTAFRPRDKAFSTVPALWFRLEVSRLAGAFRWEPVRPGSVAGRAFLRFRLPGALVLPHRAGWEARYDAIVHHPGGGDRPDLDLSDETVPCRDLWTSSAPAVDGGWAVAFSLGPGEEGVLLDAAWCACDEPVLTVHGKRLPFLYRERFASVEAVAQWSLPNAPAVFNQALALDRVLGGHRLGEAVTRLAAYSLHSWLVNTWWVTGSEGDWFSVWEGNCYFHSTLDVETTQAPFYLLVWPELLERQLRQWVRLARPEGDGLAFSHDAGVQGDVGRSVYPHTMDVEETSNVLLLAWAHWRRTGSATVIRDLAEHWEPALRFLLASDPRGTGLPTVGCANTLDDAVGVLQYATEQVYLGVKAAAACRAGAELLEHLGVDGTRYRAWADRALARVDAEGWRGDHYAAALGRPEGTNPWTGTTGSLSGVDAYHLYTANALVFGDLLGRSTPLDSDRVTQDLANATHATLGRYGCRHASLSLVPENAATGLAGASSEVGWVSMNLTRDIAALYRGVDLLPLADRYWAWQATVNTQEPALFHETFAGNHLHFYPRGVAVFGLYEAAAGHRFDAVSGVRSVRPLRPGLRAPLLSTADWTAGTTERTD